jgi:hypothetical protein
MTVSLSDFEWPLPGAGFGQIGSRELIGCSPAQGGQTGSWLYIRRCCLLIDQPVRQEALPVAISHVLRAPAYRREQGIRLTSQRVSINPLPPWDRAPGVSVSSSIFD